MDPYVSVDEETLRRERHKTRALRQSQWWKNRIGQGLCYYCNERFHPKELTLDHVVPLVRGGRTTKGNCVPACKECNSRKQSMLPLEWDDYVERLSREK
ncbi:MAG: HNH endonuclease [Desulfuromonas sp.]|nr:MAG: HNH endonuclease [Desulfuromonas sp.]